MWLKFRLELWFHLKIKLSQKIPTMKWEYVMNLTS